MKKQWFVGAVLVAGVLTVTTSGVAPERQVALVRFMRPTIIAGAAVMGQVVFEHDDARMARGEPCTRVLRYDAKHRAAGDVIVEFMCAPKAREAVTEFSATLVKAPAGPDRLVEYQFQGETEGHGVPY